MAKIGILGGTFDPIHNGHLALGKQAYEQFGLDEIWFMLSGHPPHKKGRPLLMVAGFKIVILSFLFFSYLYRYLLLFMIIVLQFVYE